MATILWALPGAPDAPSFTTLSGLAAGGYALSATVDNSAGLLESAVFDLALPSSVTCGSGAPYLGLTVLYAPDGTNFPNPPGGSAAATGLPQAAAIGAGPGAAFTRGHSQRFEILPFKLRLLIYNGLGVALPSGTITANLYRFAETVA